MPTDSFWAGVGASIQHASGDIVMVAIVICGIIFAYVKFWLPEHIKDKASMREMELAKFELEKERQTSELDLQRQRGEAQARQIEISSNQTELLRQVMTVLQSVQTTQEVIVSQMNDSKVNSHAMSRVVEIVQDDVSFIRKQVDDIHTVVFNEPKIGGSD